jgi:hypothetical protein
MATKTNAKAKPTPKPALKATPKAKAPATEKRDNRYLRAARVLIKTGEGVDLAELAIKSDLTEPAARYCLDAFKGVCQALREAKLLPAKAAPAKAPAAPKKAEQKEPVPA